MSNLAEKISFEENESLPLDTLELVETEENEKNKSINMSAKFKALQAEYSELKIKYKKLEQENKQLMEQKNYFENIRSMLKIYIDEDYSNPFDNLMEWAD